MKRPDKFEILKNPRKGVKQPYHLRMVASNGRIRWSTENMRDKSSCLKSIAVMNANAVIPWKVVDQTGEEPK